MKSSHLLFLIGLTFHRVTCEEKTANTSAGLAARSPSSLSPSPHIPYHLEQSPNFRELLSWFNLEVIGWMTRRNTLGESILGHALQDEPELLAYLLNPENNPQLKKRSRRDAGDVPGRVVEKSKRRKKRSPRRAPQCMARNPMYAEERGIQTMSDSCYYIHDVMLYPNYLVCDSEDMTSIPKLSDDHLKLDLFELNSTRVKKIPAMTFHNVEVTTVRLIQNSIETLHPAAFKGIQNTKLVEISHNENLTWIWFDGCFEGLDEVKTLKLESNQITLEDFDELYYEVEPATAVLPNLGILSFQENPLKYIPKTLFAPLQNSTLRMLVLQDCQLERIHPDALSYLPNLLQLNLNDNPGLKHNLTLPLKGLRGRGANLIQLDLARTGMTGGPLLEVLQVFSSSLVTLDLQGNSFPVLGRGSFPASMPKLRDLNLAYCGLTALGEGVFDSMPQLESLMLNSNRFKSVPGPIGTLRNLFNLDLSDMNANQGDGGPSLMNIPPNIFQHLDQLKTLIFTNTNLMELTASDLQGLIRLQLLFLNRCRLTRIADGTFSSLQSLFTLNLSENKNLRSLNAKTFSGLTSLETLYLNSTHFHIPVYRPMSLGSGHKWSAPKITDLDFASVGRAFHAALAPTSGEEFEDTYENVLRPFRHLGRLSHLYLSGNSIETIHPSLFGDLSYLEMLDLTSNEVQVWTEPVFRNNLILSKVYLGNNAFHSITEAMLEDFSQVPALPEARSKLIDLRDNTALQCDPGACRLKAGMESKSFALLEWDEDADSYQCRHAVTGRMVNIRDLTDSDCESFKPTEASTEPATPPTTPELPTPSTSESPKVTDDDMPASGFNGPKKTIVILAASLTIVLGIMVFLYLKRAQFRLFWFGLKLKVMRESTRKKNQGGRASEDKYAYDVFISYSQHDSDFVQELVPELEGSGKFLPFDQGGMNPLKAGDPLVFDNFNFDTVSTTSSTVNILRDEENFRVCLHLRDFQVGAPITENIIECVDRSRKVLIVISRKYLESQWCLFEMNLAYHRLVEGRRSSIVLVLLEDIPGKERSKVLSHLMKSRTYLELPKSGGHIQKELFWRRLKAALSLEESDC